MISDENPLLLKPSEDDYMAAFEAASMLQYTLLIKGKKFDDITKTLSFYFCAVRRKAELSGNVGQ